MDSVEPQVLGPSIRQVAATLLAVLPESERATILKGIAVLVATLLIFRLAAAATHWRKTLRLGRTVPSVKGGLPFLGHAIDLVTDSPWDVAQRWVERYGPIYRFWLFGTQFVVVAEPALLKEIMQRNMPKYGKDLAVSYRSFLPLLGTGIVTSDGAHWRMQRLRVSAALRIEVLREIPRLAQEATRRLAEKLDAIKGTGKTIEIGEEFRTLTLQVIAAALMSLSPEESDETFSKMYMPIVMEGHKRVWFPMRDWMAFLPAWWRNRGHLNALNAFITSVINRRWQLRQTEGLDCKRPKDVLDRVMDHIPASEWGPDDVQQITDEMKTFVLAGHETSATMLNWTLYELTQNAELAATATAEADAVYGGKDGGLDAPLPSSDELAKLEYTTACLKESLRKYSIVPTVNRVCIEDDIIRMPVPAAATPAAANGGATAAATAQELLGAREFKAAPKAVAPAEGGGAAARSAVGAVSGGANGNGKTAAAVGSSANGEAEEPTEWVEHFIPKGTSIMLFVKGVHDRPDLWPDASRFDPDRFMRPVAPYTFLPFIDGPRNCLGQYLSLLESRVVLSLLLHRYRFGLVNPAGADAGDRHPWMVPIIPKYGTLITVEDRQRSPREE